MRLPQEERLKLIGEIRDMIDDLYDRNRFEVVREIMGTIDRFNFAPVSDAVVKSIWTDLRKVLE